MELSKFVHIKKFEINYEDLYNIPEYYVNLHYLVPLNKNYIVGGFIQPNIEFTGSKITNVKFYLSQFVTNNQLVTKNWNISKFRQNLECIDTIIVTQVSSQISNNVVKLGIQSFGGTLNMLLEGSLYIILFFNEI